MSASQIHALETQRLQRQIDSLERENQHKTEIITTLVDKVERLKARLHACEYRLNDLD